MCKGQNKITLVWVGNCRIQGTKLHLKFSLSEVTNLNSNTNPNGKFELPVRVMNLPFMGETTGLQEGVLKSVNL